MIDLLTLHKQFITPHIFNGAVAADYTMGNGHDTLWLSDTVGENGRVFAFDIQQQAYDNTERLLRENAKYNNYELILDSHANAAQHIECRVNAGVFNLGYLPGGDKSVTTLLPSTLAAVDAAISLMAQNGVLLIAVYPGHDEGTREGEALEQKLSPLSRHEYCVSRFRIINSPTSPYFYMIESK